MAVDKPHDSFAALRHRNYLLFAGGWLPASIGLQMQGTALAWEVYERTHDPFALGILGLARALPTVVLALPAGQMIDLLNRQRVLVNTQLGLAAVSMLLAVGSIFWERSGGAPAGVWMMYVLSALTGCARVFNGPSRASLLPLILPGGASTPLFHNAITWNSGVFQLAATLGPLLAGWLIWITHAAWPVYVVAALGCLAFGITAPLIHPYVRPENYGRGVSSLWDAVRPAVLLPGILAGVRHIMQEKAVLGAIALDLFAVLLGGATALMPVYAKEILHVGPVGLGALRAAPYIGALLMAGVLANRPPFRRAGRALLWSVAGFGACTIGFGFSTNFALSLALLATLGALDNISVVVRHVLVSVRTPDALRGRVSTINAVFIESSNELGGFESGLVAKLFGPVFSVVSGGIGTLLVVLGMAWWLPELRRLGALTALEPQPAPSPKEELCPEAAAS